MIWKPTFSFLLFLSTFPVFSALAAEEVADGNKYLENQCFDYYSRPVLHVRNDSLGDVAFSDLMRHRGVPMGPMTIINAKRLSKLSQASQAFFIVHECGHHVLGHLYIRRPGNIAEQQADCYAIRTLIRNGMFTMDDVRDVQADMKKYAQASFHHVTGEERAKELMNCLE